MLATGTKVNNMARVFTLTLKENRSMVNGNMERESDGLKIDYYELTIKRNIFTSLLTK